MSKILGIINDLHIPWHHSRNVKLALDTLHGAFDLDELHLLGDIVDFYQLSAHHRHPRFRGQLLKAIDTAQRFFTRLRERWPSIPIVYHEGNHEERAWKYVHRMAEELADIEELTVPGLLKLNRFNISWRPITTPLDLGPVVLTHGTSAMKLTGSNARKLLTEFGKSAVQGHSHRVCMVAHRFPDGRVIRGYELGCLCKMIPAPFNAYTKGKMDWQQSCTVMEVDSADFHIHQFLLHQGKVIDI